jgi:hypothetical protein
MLYVYALNNRLAACLFVWMVNLNSPASQADKTIAYKANSYKLFLCNTLIVADLTLTE